MSKTQGKTPEKSAGKVSKSVWGRKGHKTKKGSRKISKFYWRRKWIKLQYHCECNKNLSEEQKEELADQYRRNYYIAHNK